MMKFDFLHSQLRLFTPFPDVIIQLILEFWRFVSLLDGKFDRKTPTPLKEPRGVAVTGKGNNMIIAIVEYTGHRVQILRWNDLSVLRVLGTGVQGNGSKQFHSPYGGIVIQGDEIFISDMNNHRVQVFNVHSGSYCRTVGGIGKLTNPVGLAIRGDEFFIVENDVCRISVWNHKHSELLRHWGKYGTGDTEFRFDCSFLCFTLNGEELLVTDGNNDVIKVFNPNNGQFIRKFGQGQLCYPTGIAVSENHVYVADGHNDIIQVFNLSGEVIKTWGENGYGDGQFRNPKGIAFANERLIVTETTNSRVQWFR